MRRILNILLASNSASHDIEWHTHRDRNGRLLRRWDYPSPFSNLKNKEFKSLCRDWYTVFSTYFALLILNGNFISLEECCVTPISMLPAHLGITRSSRTWNSSPVLSVLLVITMPLLKYSKALKIYTIMST